MKTTKNSDEIILEELQRELQNVKTILQIVLAIIVKKWKVKISEDVKKRYEIGD